MFHRGRLGSTTGVQYRVFCVTCSWVAFIFFGGGGLAQGLGIRLFAFGGAYWPLATAHSDPLWVRTCFGCVN